MAHQNDSFVHEVNEELRSDRMRTVWSRYSGLLIALAVLIVLGTAGTAGYEYWSRSRASNAGDQFMAALKLATDGKSDDALAAFTAIEAQGHGDYPVLARMRSATLLATKGDNAGAVAAFDAIGKDTGVPAIIRDVAHIRAAWLLIDTGTYAQVSAEAEVLSTPENALRYSAREALGLSAYKAGELIKAKEWFKQIVDDAGAPRNVSNRAQMMLDVIAASGKAP